MDLPTSDSSGERTTQTVSFESALNTPGSAEFLSTLLKSAKNTKCSHFPKIKPGPACKIPYCLGLFSLTRPITSWLRTERICRNCYNLAVPDGYIIWSTGAVGAQSGPHLPPCFEAGTEGFGSPETSSQGYPPACTIADQEAGDAFAWLQEQKQPFFIDFLHLSRPFNGMAIDITAENARVSAEIKVAFDNAAKCLLTHEAATERDISALNAGSRLVSLPRKVELLEVKACIELQSQ